jgi:hypothetical protein
VGDGVVVGAEPDTTAIDVGIVAGKGSIVLDQPLRFDNPAGTIVTRVDADPIVQAREAMPAPDEGATSERESPPGVHGR